MAAECIETDLTTKEKDLQELKPGVAPITQEAPRVISGKKTAGATFAPLLKLGESASGDFKISYGKSSARLFWPGLSVSLLELVQLLKTLPRENRIHGSSRAGDTVRSFAYDDKLHKSKLAPPEEDGLLLYWKQPPAALAELDGEKKPTEEPATSGSRGPEPEAPADPKTESTSIPVLKNHTALAGKLKNSPRFQAALQALGDDKPAQSKVLQALEMLCHSSGQVGLEEMTAKLELDEEQLTTLLSQMDTTLHKPGEHLLSLSINRKVLLLNLDGLSRSFSLELSDDDTKSVTAESLEGEKRSVRLPFEVKAKERSALEALLRYGRLSEEELSRLTGSRRIGGLLERLLSKLEGEGFHGLSVVGEGAEGRIFQLESNR